MSTEGFSRVFDIRYLHVKVHSGIPLRLQKTPTVFAQSDATLDKSLLLNCHRTSRHGEQNSRRSRILPAANIQVAHVHVNNFVSQMARVYAIGTRTHAVQRSSAIFETWRVIIL